MPLYIPADIVGAIVDILHDDKRTLTACTLVSRAWLHRSHFHLFRSLTYDVKSDGSGFSPLLDFLQSSPQLANFIRELTLNGLTKVVLSSYKMSPHHEVISYSALLDILDSLPALSDLELRRVEFLGPQVWTEEEHRRIEVGTTRELSLHRLNLCAIGHPARSGIDGIITVPEFLRILSLFSSVQELRVSLIYPASSPGNSHIAPRKPLYGQVKPFYFIARDEAYPREFWDAINRTISVPVGSLCLTGGDFKRVRELQNFGTKVQHLMLDFTKEWACE